MQERPDAQNEALETPTPLRASHLVDVEDLKAIRQLAVEGHAATQAAIVREADRIIEYFDYRVGLLERSIEENIRSR